jgi:hypothetical protein
MSNCMGYPAIGRSSSSGRSIEADRDGRLSVHGVLLLELCRLVLCEVDAPVTDLLHKRGPQVYIFSIG